MKTFNFLLTYYKSIEQIKFFLSMDISSNSLPFLYAIHHCLINIIKLFYVFFYLNLVIAHCVSYFLESCIIQVQLYLTTVQLFQHISQFELCFIPQVFNYLFLAFQQSHVLINVFLIFYHYHLLLLEFYFDFNGLSHSILMLSSTIHYKAKLEIKCSIFTT